MKKGRGLDMGLLALVWLMVLWPPLRAGMALLAAGRPGIAVGTGISLLSMPCDLAMPASSLAGWNFLDPPARGETGSGALPVENPSSNLTAGPQAGEAEVAGPGLEERLRLHGQVGSGPGRLYCFFDTRESRWFRMTHGGVDPALEVRLERTSASGLCLVDLESGRRYLIPDGERQPVPMAP